ncbi:MAG: hypothetical protein R6X14_05545 [bacterium]
MNRPCYRRVLLVGVMLLALLVACDIFPTDDDFEPTGSPFNLDAGIALVDITGGEQPQATGTYTVNVTGRATGGAPAEQRFPAGLQFVSTQRRVQHVLVLKSQQVEFDTAATRRSLGVFCCNRYRRTPDELDTFDLGPVTNNPGLQEITGLVSGRDISAALWMVQRAVWMVTDSTGLNQAYRDSLAALPAKDEDRAPGDSPRRR